MIKIKVLKFLLWLTALHLITISVVYSYFNYEKIINFKHEILNEQIISTKNQSEFSITLSSLTEEPDPTKYDFYGKRELNFVYEPLVAFDQYFNIKSALAVSWGMISETEWIFKLRKNVKFHDNSSFGAEDVIATYNRAKTQPGSSLTGFIKNIESIEDFGDNVIKITTKNPYPLFLAKLTNLYIMPEEYALNYSLTQHIGTGMFRLIKRDSQKVEFEKYQSYWNKQIKLPNKMTIYKKPNKYERLGDIMANITDILGDVPPLFYDQIKKRSEAQIIQSPGVKSVFILFNMEHPFLNNINNRNAMSYAIDREELMNLAGKSAKPANQFAGSGIFGFNPNIETRMYNIDRSKNIMESDGIMIMSLLTTEDNAQLAEFLKQQFDKIGLRIKIKILSAEEIIEDMKTGFGDLYLVGWDFEEGSVDSFYQQIVMQNGEYNGLNYSNTEANSEIGLGIYEINARKRLKNYQRVMSIITLEDPIGIPLFTIDNLSAIMPSKFKILNRADGIIYFSE